VNALGPWVQEGLGQAVMAVVPLVVAGLVGSALAGWLAMRMGLQDPVMAGVLRGLFVLGALAAVAEELGEDARRFATAAWGELSAVGRAER
jgi:putative effector of murein hydrolase